MGAIQITRFGGIIPRLGARLLPDTNAQAAVNAKLFSGELRAWNRQRFLAQLPFAGAQSVYRYEDEGATRVLAFDDDTDVVRAPLLNDSFRRLYWANRRGVFYNTMERIRDGEPEDKLGVPQPVVPGFAVSATGGSSATAVTRIYAVVLVSRYGEEGPVIALTASAAGPVDATWEVNGLDTLIYDSSYTAVAKLRLYRTVTSASTVAYRPVAEWDVGVLPSSYTDTKADTAIVTQPALESFEWGPPPEGLVGLITIAGGWLAGFRGREVWMTPPYRPHAWPESYKIAVEDDVVALGTFANSIVVATTGEPVLLTGTTPETVAMEKGKAVLPCLSKRGLVSLTDSVMYPSTNGLISVGQGGIAIASEAYVTKDEWQQRFNPSNIRAAAHQNRYLAFYTDQIGFVLGFDDPTTGFTELQLPRVTAVTTDRLTGQTLVVVDDKLYEWDGDFGDRLQYVWRSKPFLVPKPTNFAALQLRGEFVVAETSGAELLPPGLPLGGHAINAYTLNGPTVGGIAAAVGYPINGPGVPGAGAIADSIVLTRVYGDGVLRWQGQITSEAPRRLPSGYKAVLWEIELIGKTPLLSATIAETAKGLENVP